MRRLSYYLLLTCLAFAVWCAAGAFAGPLLAPSALAHFSADQSREKREIDKYNRKLTRLEIKRIKDRQKLEAEYLKILRRERSIDLRELQERLDDLQRKRDKVEKKYQRELQKLEREATRKGR